MKLKLFFIGFALMAAWACNNTGTASDSTDSAATTENTSETKMTTKTSVEVPAATRTSFEEKYPAASNVTWAHYEVYVPIDWTLVGWPTMDESDYVATFNMDNSNYWVWYDDTGNWVGTVTEINTAALPAAVNSTITSQYPNYTVVSAKKENDKDRTAYEIKLESGNDKITLLLDENGKVLKKKATIAGEKTKEKAVKDSVPK
jgi:hypothetical protein